MSKGRPQFRMTGTSVKVKKYRGPVLKYTGEDTEPQTTEDKKVHYDDPDREGLSFCGTRMVAWGRKKPLRISQMAEMTLEELVQEWHYCQRCLNKVMIEYGIIFK